VRLLSEYIRIDTTNPPGNELQAARFLRDVLKKEGIESEILDTAELGPGRANFYARLHGSGAKRAIALVHHMDVVPADKNALSVDPFAGLVKDGYIWGRGALDMKGYGIAQLMTLIALKRSGVTLARDLVLIANSDEELLGAKGAAVFVERHQDLLRDVEYVITEGTPNRVDAGRLVHYSVAVAEKLNYSQRLVSRGTPSHASRPNPANPVLRLLSALNRVASYESPLIVTPTVEKYFRDIAPMYQGDQRVWLADIRAALAHEQARAWVLSDPAWHAYLRDTAQITVLTASNKTNVIPAEASAELDVRILPGEAPEEFMTGLQAAVGDERIEWTRLFPLKPRLASPVDTELFRAVEQVARRRDPDAVVTTPLVVGGTDMPWYRQAGIVAYGIDPFRIDRLEHQRGLHGNDERLPVETLGDGIQFLYDLLKTLN